MARTLRWLFWIAAMFLLPATASRADERCYLLVFAAQRHPNLVRYSHTFAAFVRASGEGPDCEQWCLDTVTISWLPKSLNLRPLIPFRQAGMNPDLPFSLNFALQNGDCIALWGPYEICPELYYRAMERAQFLETSATYHVSDRYRRPRVLDCVHALSGVDRDPGSFHTWLAHGDMASYLDLHHFGRWIICPEVTHDWLIPRLCLDQYPISRRGYWEEPNSLLPILPPFYKQPSQRILRRAAEE